MVSFIYIFFWENYVFSNALVNLNRKTLICVPLEHYEIGEQQEPFLKSLLSNSRTVTVTKKLVLTEWSL